MAEPRPMTLDSMTALAGNEAGAMLRAARERRGMDAATLASLLKVPTSRLEALEAGRLGELPDATFARALAQSVCRALGIDSGPVLERLPRVQPTGLEKVSTGLNTPFRDRPGSIGQVAEWTPWRKPALWAAAALLVGAAVFVWLGPRGGVGRSDAASQPAAGASAGSSGAASAPVSVSPAAPAWSSLPATATGAADTPPSGAAAADQASAPVTTATTATTAVETRLSVVRPSWIQATDASGQTLLSRELAAGDTAEFSAVPPLRLKIGNAAATRLVYRGQMVDLEPYTRDNVANVELH